MPLHFRAYGQALGPDAPLFTEEMFYDFAGVPAEKVLQRLKENFGLSWDPYEMAAEKERHFGAMMHQVKSIEAVEEVIHAYEGRLPMAVASGGTRDNIEKTLDLLDLTEYFPVVVTADEVPNGKPAPDIFIEAARQLGVPAEKCLVFEDADMGIRAAEAAGMQYIDVRRLDGIVE